MLPVFQKSFENRPVSVLPNYNVCQAIEGAEVHSLFRCIQRARMFKKRQRRSRVEAIAGKIARPAAFLIAFLIVSTTGSDATRVSLGIDSFASF
jgi:hypothetical protein